jgi:hypothetical protein
MRPSGSPTASPDASSVRYWSAFFANASITGVSAWYIALPTNIFTLSFGLEELGLTFHVRPSTPDRSTPQEGRTGVYHYNLAEIAPSSCYIPHIVLYSSAILILAQFILAAVHAKMHACQ